VKHGKYGSFCFDPRMEDSLEAQWMTDERALYCSIMSELVFENGVHIKFI